MTITLHGLPRSNYYNKVKMALPEKGEQFTQADLAAFNNLPLVGMASKAVFGEDLLLATGVDYKPYLKPVGERPSAHKVVADRKAAQQQGARGG